DRNKGERYVAEAAGSDSSGFLPGAGWGPCRKDVSGGYSRNPEIQFPAVEDALRREVAVENRVLFGRGGSIVFGADKTVAGYAEKGMLFSSVDRQRALGRIKIQSHIVIVATDSETSRIECVCPTVHYRLAGQRYGIPHAGGVVSYRYVAVGNRNRTAV